MNVRASGLNWWYRNLPSGLGTTMENRDVLTLIATCLLADWSSATVARRANSVSPSGAKANIPNRPSTVMCLFPVAESHKRRTFSFALADATIAPSGEMAMLVTGRMWSRKVVRIFPLAISQTTTSPGPSSPDTCRVYFADFASKSSSTRWAGPFAAAAIVPLLFTPIAVTLSFKPFNVWRTHRCDHLYSILPRRQKH